MFSMLLSVAWGCSEQQPAIITGLEGKPLPSFSFLLMDSTKRINTDSILSGKPTVLVYFSPYCPYCRAQTNEIIEGIKSLKNIQFFLLSDFPFNQVKQYYEQYKLSNYPNITVGKDLDSYFTKYFNASAVPYLAIYDADKRLKQVFMGKTEINEIKHVALE